MSSTPRELAESTMGEVERTRDGLETTINDLVELAQSLQDKQSAEDLKKRLGDLDASLNPVRQAIKGWGKGAVSKEEAAAAMDQLAEAETGLETLADDVDSFRSDLEGNLREYFKRATLQEALRPPQEGVAGRSYEALRALREDSPTRLGTEGHPFTIRTTRALEESTPRSLTLYSRIRGGAHRLSWVNFSSFMDEVLCGDVNDAVNEDVRQTRNWVKKRMRLPFPDVDAYRQLKIAAEVFMMVNCGIDTAEIDESFLADEAARWGQDVTRRDLRRFWKRLLDVGEEESHGRVRAIPYLGIIARRLDSTPIVDAPNNPYLEPMENRLSAIACDSMLRHKLTNPCFIELIWSYWHEEGMLVQTMNAISRRFQNQRGPVERDPLAALEIDPIRSLGDFLWGYIQDEQHRLTVPRRTYEYDHHYGLRLVGKATPTVRGADSRSRFLEAFHHLLFLCSIFFKEDDDTTVVADGFPVLNALREVHLLLTQGAHNQYGELPWTARQEMLMQEWLLARPEFREFLPRRIMVDYPEEWMDSVETMKSLQGWTDTSIMHFRDLGVFGEQILLGIRFQPWPSIFRPAEAANWARYWRAEIQGYIHGYRAVTGIDLTERVDSTLPSTLLMKRLEQQVRVKAGR